MKRVKAQPISNVVLQFLREEGLETPLNERRLISAWSDVVGVKINRSTRDIKIINRVLIVTFSSSVCRNEVFLRRSEFVKKLNEAVASSVIDDIKVN